MPVILILFALAAGGYYVVKQQNKTNTGGEGLTDQIQKSAQLRSRNGSGIYKGSMINRKVLDDEKQNSADGSTAVASTSTRTVVSSSGRRTTGIATFRGLNNNLKSPFKNGI